MTTPAGPNPWAVFGVIGSRIWRGYTRPSDPPLTEVIGRTEAASVIANLFGQAGIGPRAGGAGSAPPGQWIDSIAPTPPPLPGQPPPIILPGGAPLPPPSLPQRIVWGVGGRVLPWLVIGREVWRRTPDKAKREIKRRGKKVLRGAYDKAKEYGPWVAILAGFEAWRDRRASQGTMPADSGGSVADAPTAMPGGAPIRRPPRRTRRTTGPRRGRGPVVLATPPLLPGVPGSPGEPGRAPVPSGTAPAALPGGAPAPGPGTTPAGGVVIAPWPGSPAPPPAPSRPRISAGMLLPFLPLLLPRSGSPARGRAPATPRDPEPAFPSPQPQPQFSYLTGFQGGAVGYRDCPPCEKKKRTSKRTSRTECYSGTYTEKASGLVKRKKRKVPCR